MTDEPPLSNLAMSSDLLSRTARNRGTHRDALKRFADILESFRARAKHAECGGVWIGGLSDGMDLIATTLMIFDNHGKKRSFDYQQLSEDDVCGLQSSLLSSGAGGGGHHRRWLPRPSTRDRRLRFGGGGSAISTPSGRSHSPVTRHC